MKIIYGITKSNFGGAQRYVFDLAKQAKKLGHDVSVICGGNGLLAEKLREHGVRVISIPYLQRDISLVDEFRAFHFIFRTLYEEKPDVFHTNSSKMGGLGNLGGRLAGAKKIVFTSHGWEFNAPRPWYARILVKLFSWLIVLFSHKTICVSEKSRRDISGWPFIKRKLAVIHNGIEKFELLPRNEARRKLDIGESEQFVVGALAELHPVKGLDTLLIAWEKFSSKHPAKLVILGDGEEREALEEMIEILGINNSATLKGFVENARQYLGAFDALCLPSRSENLPYALLEAGLAGLPVIATHVGGIPEIIEPSISGALVEKEDPDALFSTLMLLQNDKKLRERLGENLKERVLKEFSLREMSEKTFKAYS